MSHGYRQGHSQGYRLADLENVLSERGLSQADLARRSGLSAPTVRKAATGGEKVSAQSANKIASALRVQLQALCHDRRKSSTGNTDTTADGGTEHPDFEPRKMREAMAKLGMNPTEVAARTELSVATVSSALRGLREPQKDTIARIAAAFGKAPEELYSKHSTSNNPWLESPAPAPDMELRLVAGQSRTALYPVEISKDDETSTPVQTPVQQKVVEPTTARGEDANDTFGSLLSRLSQARQMVASLMEHIGNLETQVRQARPSEEAAGQGGANGRSGGQ